MIEDINWKALFEETGAITGETSFDIKDVRWTNLFKCTKEVNGEYGVEWDYSNPSPALTRTGDAAGFADPVPATSLAGAGSSPFDNIMPWSGMRMCNIIDGEVAYWQGDPQFSETDYDTMVFIPEFWYKAEKNTDTSKWNWSISPTEREGYAKHPGSGRFIGRYHSSGGSSGVFAKSGKKPVGSISRTDFRSYSHSKGAKWYQQDIDIWSAVQLLYLVEFADFNAQEKIGGGQNSGAIAVTGSTDGSVYHTLKTSGSSNQYRWIENPYSNMHTFIDGVVTTSKQVYIRSTPLSYSDTTTGMTATGITLPNTGFITGFGFSDVCPWAFIPDEAEGGSETTKVSDTVSSNTGTRGYRGGGNFQNTGNYGFFYVSSYDMISATGASLGSRLQFVI